MNEEMSARLAQELLDAADDDARARVVVHWLPDFARCQITTAGRVKAQGAKIDSLCAKVDGLAAKMEAYHAPATKGSDMKTKTADDPRTARLKIILGFFAANWQGVFLFLLLLQSFGLTDLLKSLFSLVGGAP